MRHNSKSVCYVNGKGLAHISCLPGARRGVAQLVRQQANILALALLMAHCSTTATITTNEGRQISGELRRSPGEYQLIAGENGDERVERSRIIAIDHPGKPAMITGASLVAVSAVAAAILISNRECREGCAFPIAGLTVPLLTGASGAGMFIWGYSTWSDSQTAAKPLPHDAQAFGAQFGYAYRF